MVGRRTPKITKPLYPWLKTPPSGKQLGRFFSSDGVDGEVVLAKLLVFLECSDSHYIDKKFSMFFNMYLHKFKLKVRCQN